MSVYVSRPSGLLQPFEPPALTMDEAIDRGWHRRDDGRLMEANPEEFLTLSSPYVVYDIEERLDQCGNYSPRPVWWPSSA